MSTSIEEVLSRHKSELLRKAIVMSAGIGESDGERVIIVFVREKLPNDRLQPDDVIPWELEGYRVDVREQQLHPVNDSEMAFEQAVRAGPQVIYQAPSDALRAEFVGQVVRHQPWAPGVYPADRSRNS